MKRLSQGNDGFCKLCGNPAADGLADAQGIWCERHGRFRAVAALESACFDLLRTYGREDYKRTLEGIDSGVYSARLAMELADA